MADNFSILEPTSGGKTFASDDISSVHYPRQKLVHGADGASSGDVNILNGLPVGPCQSGAYEAIVEKLYSFFTTSYQSLSLTNVATSRIILVSNFTDAYLLLSFDAGSTHHCIVAPSTLRTVNVPSGTTQVHARYNNASGLPSPGTGYCWFEVVR